LLHKATAQEPGIVAASVSPEGGDLTLEYDPQAIAERDVERIASEVGPGVELRLLTCTLHLGQLGGRACESCAAALEKRLSLVPGVRRATASYRGGTLTVAYDSTLLSPATIKRKVAELGVPLAPPAPPVNSEQSAVGRRQEADKPLPTADRRLLSAQTLQVALTAITFVGMLLGLAAENLWHAPAFAWVMYAVAYVAGSAFAVKSSLEALAHRVIDIDLLMVLAAFGAAIVGAPFEGALLLFLFSLSNVLQDFALDRTRNAIRALMRLRPSRANVKRGGEILLLPIEQIRVGDAIVVKPGERIALDGTVASGESTVDQAAITGESIPVAKRHGDGVFAGTINKGGSLEVEVTRLAHDSTIAHLIQLVEEAQSEKAQTQRFIDKFEQRYALVVLAGTLLAVLIPVFLLDEAFEPAFYRAMTLMVAASPCALVISTPASILSAIGNGARKGILFKGGVHLEQAATIRVVAFDKTGTLTQGKPVVTDVRVLPHPDVPWRGDEAELLSLAGAVQSKSEHALARATLEAAKERNVQLSEAFAFQATSGKGVRGVVEGREVRIGNLRYFEELSCVGIEEAREEVARLQREGKTCVLVGLLSEDAGTAYVLGLIAFADVLRPDSSAVVRELKALGVERVVMLTGDNHHVAAVIAAQAGIDEFYADLLPEDKVRVIREIAREHGPVAMVGDGVNDAPALAVATLGIAMGAAGTDVALETADVVLMGDDLGNIPYVISLSRETRKTLVINLGVALGMITLMIAAIFFAQLPLPLAVVGHEGGTVLVSLYGLRLLLYKRRRKREA
jgi:Cd2+/Zn2+-exporting ATPase